jgi:hypothetical protein
MRIVAGGAVYIKSAGVGGGENRQDEERAERKTLVHEPRL